MDNQQPRSNTTKYDEFVSPVDSSKKAFLGKKLKISGSAQRMINQLGRFEQIKLHNNLNELAADVVNHNLHTNKNIYLELPYSFLKFSITTANAPYIGTITEAKLIQKPNPLRASPDESQHLNDCKTRTTRGLTREIVNAGYQFEKVLDPNFFTAKELVNIQTLRMREHVRNWKAAEQTNTQWADVCYGAKPGLLNNGSGDEIIALSAIFGISEQTRLLSKSYFSALNQTSIKKIFHRYAVIFGHPYYFKGQPEKNIQDVMNEVNINRDKGLKHICEQNAKYGSDVIIQIDSDLNVHKFFRNGQYAYINC